MRKLIVLFLMSIFCYTINAQTYPEEFYRPANKTENSKSIWDNSSICMGYSYTNIDDYKDHNIDITAMIYGAYIDCSIGTSLRDFGYKTDKTSYSLNFGYLFPAYNDGTYKILIGPVLGYTAMGWSDNYHETYYDPWYGYSNYSSNRFITADSYFNYGAAMQIGLGHFAINCKATRSTLGIGIGYMF